MYKHNRECDEKHARKSVKTFGKMFKEYLKAPSPMYDHLTSTAHVTTVEAFNMVDGEGYNLAKNVKWSVYMRVDNITLMRIIDNMGFLPAHIYQPRTNIQEQKSK